VLGNVIDLRPHRKHLIDAAYAYRYRTFSGLCISGVGHTGGPCENE